MLRAAFVAVDDVRDSCCFEVEPTRSFATDLRQSGRDLETQARQSGGIAEKTRK